MGLKTCRLLVIGDKNTTPLLYTYPSQTTLGSVVILHMHIHSSVFVYSQETCSILTRTLFEPFYQFLYTICGCFVVNAYSH